MSYVSVLMYCIVTDVSSMSLCNMEKVYKDLYMCIVCLLYISLFVFLLTGH